MAVLSGRDTGFWGVKHVIAHDFMSVVFRCNPIYHEIFEILCGIVVTMLKDYINNSGSFVS